MPCFTKRITDDQLVVGAYLSPGNLSPTVAPEDQEALSAAHSALIDTGATGCGLSSVLARKIGALPVGKTEVFTANGVALASIYIVDIHILMDERDEESAVAFAGIQATEFPDDGSDIPVILGMDLICHGSLHVAGDTFTFAL